MYNSFYPLLILVVLCSCSNSNTNDENAVASQTEVVSSTNNVMLSSEIVWEKLNPARGDQSPQARTIWGDRKGKVPTGFLAKFVDGFSSPPHIHNVTYRAVVIKGTVHNDDPSAEKMWMKPGSFWTQPVGEAHITSAKGEENIALVEISNGPYLVMPIEEAYDSGERPINVEAANIVWLDSKETNWIDEGSGAELSYLVEESGDQFRSLFVRFPSGYQGELESSGTVFHAVVISGNLDYKLPQSGELKNLDPGSYFGSTERARHAVENKMDEPTSIYVRTNGDISVN